MPYNKGHKTKLFLSSHNHFKKPIFNLNFLITAEKATEIASARSDFNSLKTIKTASGTCALILKVFHCF